MKDAIHTLPDRVTLEKMHVVDNNGRDGTILMGETQERNTMAIKVIIHSSEDGIVGVKQQTRFGGDILFEAHGYPGDDPEIPISRAVLLRRYRELSELTDNKRSYQKINADQLGDGPDAVLMRKLLSERAEQFPTGRVVAGY